MAAAAQLARAPGGRVDGGGVLGSPGSLAADPAAFALLRGGPQKRFRLEVFQLLEEGHLVSGPDGRLTRVAVRDAIPPAAVGRAVLGRCEFPWSLSEIWADRAIQASSAGGEAQLAACGLLIDAATRGRRNGPVRGVMLGLSLLIGVKIMAAIAGGHHNIGFLLVLTGLACLLAAGLARARRSLAGERSLANLQILLRRQRSRGAGRRPGGSAQDGEAAGAAALVGAVFGLSALDAGAFGFLDTAFPGRLRAAGRDAAGGSSCGASCGASSGSSCASSSSCGDCGS